MKKLSNTFVYCSRLCRDFALLSFCLCTFVFSFAQAPQGFNYQAVARDSAGNILTAQNIGLKVSIVADSLGGTVVYSETHSAITDNFGVFTMQPGSGTPVTGAFPAIDWGSATHFIQIEMDPAGSTNYQLMGTSQLLSVPYALFANTAANAKTADTADYAISGVTGSDGDWTIMEILYTVRLIVRLLSKEATSASGPLGQQGNYISLIQVLVLIQLGMHLTFF